MNLKVEEILILIVAFVIGYFVSNMISGSSSGSGSRVKAVGGKHHYSIWGDTECVQQTFTGNKHNRNDKPYDLLHCGHTNKTYPVTKDGHAECTAECPKE